MILLLKKADIVITGKIVMKIASRFRKEVIILLLEK